jgi:hypothetical protein
MKKIERKHASKYTCPDESFETKNHCFDGERDLDPIRPLRF